MNNFYIYIYLDPRKPGKYCYNNFCFLFEPFYIGKGKNKRCMNIYNRNIYFKNKINKIKKSNSRLIIFKLYDNLFETLSFELEKQLIQEIGRFDLNLGPLVNMTDGGDGPSGIIFSEDHKKKISEKMSGANNPNFGKHLSDDIIKKFIKTRKENIRSGKINYKGKFSRNLKLTEKKVIQIKMLIKLKFKNKEISKLYNISQAVISSIKCEKTWSYIKI